MEEGAIRGVSQPNLEQQGEASLTSTQNPESGPSQGSSRDHNALQPTINARARRAQVSAACQACRQKKRKCDALRPCTPCRTKNITCHYETLDEETHKQASKRRFDEVSQSRDTLAELIRMLGSGTDRDAGEIIKRIRNGQSPETIVNFIKASDNALVVAPDPKKLALQAFLVHLAHSTGSLRDIIRLAELTIEPTAKIRLPDPEDLLALRNRIVYFKNFEDWLRRPERLGKGSFPLLLPGSPKAKDTNAGSSASVQSLLNKDEASSNDHNPPHQVPAAPWTTLTTDDDAVSHLVSLFLAWINPTWRFVEQDLFLLGMRSKQLDSRLCSPFLVNSICAIASLHSEHDVAFVNKDRERVTRGQHFHDEAYRLWVLEEMRPSLTNVQALCILSLESNYRARDRLGLKLIRTAVELNYELSLSRNEETSIIEGVSKQDLARVRLSNHWTVKCTDIIMRIAFMNDAETRRTESKHPKIHDTFDDTVEFWTGWPLTQRVVPHRPTLYLLERCKLALLFEELYDLIFASDYKRSVLIHDFASAVDQLLAKMKHWYQHLPFELHYQWPMSVAVWELHASYLAFSMVLLLVARTRFLGENESSDAQPLADQADDAEARFRSQSARDKLSDAISFAQSAAQMLGDFRERYGLKFSPAWLLQLQAVTAGVLLLDPELAAHSSPSSPVSADDADGQIHDSHTAFDEVFRCLLGTGVEVMIARGIARMMYHTALEQKILLSRSTRSMLQIMSDTAWRPSDLNLVNSVFPNFATTRDHEDRERMTEMLSKWEKLEI